MSLNLCLCTADLKFHTERAARRIENLRSECRPNEIRGRYEPISFERRVHGDRSVIDRMALDRFETAFSEAEFTKFEILRVSKCSRSVTRFYGILRRVLLSLDRSVRYVTIQRSYVC